MLSASVMLTFICHVYVSITDMYISDAVFKNSIKELDAVLENNIKFFVFFIKNYIITFFMLLVVRVAPLCVLPVLLLCRLTGGSSHTNTSTGKGVNSSPTPGDPIQRSSQHLHHPALHYRPIRQWAEPAEHRL